MKVSGKELSSNNLTGGQQISETDNLRWDTRNILFRNVDLISEKRAEIFESIFFTTTRSLGWREAKAEHIEKETFLL